jgi:hypothetical protein
MDVGNVRHWPRMTREQLVRVFPNQRTVHLPTDGQPLAGYALALADLEKRGNSPSAVTLAAVGNRGGAKPNIFARMFGKKTQDDEDETEAGSPDARALSNRPPRQNIFAGADAPKTEPAAAPNPGIAVPPAPAPIIAAAPMPKPRPATTQVAAVPVQPEKPVRPEKPATNYVLAAVTPNDIIKSRGYWVGLPESPTENSAARRRPAGTPAADPAATASIGPFTAPAGYGDRKAGEYNLAFASQQPDPVPPRAKPMGSSIPRKTAAAANTTVAVKGDATEPAEVYSHLAGNQQPVADYDSPWLRAVVLTPSVQASMNTTLFGQPDFRGLKPMLHTPSSMVVMTFSGDPNFGMRHQQFTGSAVSFPATTTFRNRTASLR